MRRMFALLVILTTSNAMAQEDLIELADCMHEKDLVFVDWSNEINKAYAEKARVKGFSRKKMRAFYCQNLIAAQQMESKGFVKTQGGFTAAAHAQQLVFTIKLDDILYVDKLDIYVGPRQKINVENSY